MVEFLSRHRGRRTGHDEGDHLLAPFSVWAANDRDFQYTRMAQQDFFEFAWVDIAAAINDHVFRTVLKRDKAVLVEGAVGMAVWNEIAATPELGVAAVLTMIGREGYSFLIGWRRP